MISLEELNKKQLEAVKTEAKRCICLGGPSTGKSSILALRFAYLLDKGAEVESILVLVINNINAHKIKYSICEATGLGLERLKVFTLEGFAQDVLNSEFKERGLSNIDKILLDLVVFFEENLDILGKYRKKYKNIIVDNLDLMTESQRRLVGLLTNKSFFATSQSDCVLNNSENFNVIRLNENYISTENIVKGASSLIKNNNSENFNDYVSLRDSSGAKIELVKCKDSKSEEDFIINKIQEQVGLGLNFSDIAVIVRTESDVKSVSKSFQQSSVPFKKFLPMIDLKPISDLLNTPGVQVDVEFSGFVRKSCIELNIKDEVRDCLTALASFYNSMEFKDALKLFTLDLIMFGDKDLYDSKSDKVSIITMEESVELAFSLVFIAGCEDGNIPLMVDGVERDIETERALLFFAMTRAKDRLFLTYASRRQKFGYSEYLAESPFLTEISSNFINRLVVSRSEESEPSQQSLFD